MAIKQYQAAGAVVMQQGRIDGLDPERVYVLLLDRPDRDEVRLPKGHIDPGEDALTAALRETEEEAGFIDLDVLADLGSHPVEFDYRGDHYRRDEHYFLVALGSPSRRKRPAHDAKQFHPLWIEMDRAADMLTFAAEQEVVRAAVRRYRQLQ